VVLLDGIAHERQPELIVRAIESLEAVIATDREGLVYFGVGERLRLAFVPAEPGVDATVLANLLFNIEANPILHGPGKWVSRDLGRRRLTTKERLILLPIVAHVAWFTKPSGRTAPFSFVSVRRCYAVPARHSVRLPVETGIADRSRWPRWA